MTTIKRFIKAYQDFFNKGEAGDAGLLEGELYGLGTNPNVLAQLQDFAGYYPKIDLEQLKQLPAGTLGYEYAQHMLKNGIQPLAISADLREEAERHLFALRYTVTHDLFHVLLGFDTSYAGEMGVYGFTVGQNYSKAISLISPLALLLASIIKPKQIKVIFANFSQGKTLGKQTGCLLAYSFEENWASPISEVRAELELVSDEEQLERQSNCATPNVVTTT